MAPGYIGQQSGKVSCAFVVVGLTNLGIDQPEWFVNMPTLFSCFTNSITGKMNIIMVADIFFFVAPARSCSRPPTKRASARCGGLPPATRGNAHCGEGQEQAHAR